MTVLQTQQQPLALQGDLDQRSAPALKRAVQDVPPGSRLVIDLAAVPFVDSLGIGALIGAIRRVHERGGSVAISSPTASVAHVLRLTGVSDLVPVVRAATATATATTAVGE